MPVQSFWTIDDVFRQRSGKTGVGRCGESTKRRHGVQDSCQTALMQYKFGKVSIKLAAAAVRALAGTCLLASAGFVSAQTVSTAEIESAANASLLLEKYTLLEKQLGKTSFGRPLVLESSEDTGNVNGNAYAVLDASFNTVSTTFKGPNHWCEVMILHINTKYCRATSDNTPSTLKVNIGKKTPQALEDAFALEFAMRQVSASPRYLAVRLNAEKGPLGTQNYRIEFEAVPLPSGKTFMHLRYAYGYGVAGRLAMQGYLATIGSGKVGFTHLNGDQSQGYVGGMRGTVERNTVRYFLAIEAYLASLNRPAAQQLGARLEHWFDATEQFPLQLHEIDRSSYLAMKRDEYIRQQSQTKPSVPAG